MPVLSSKATFFYKRIFPVISIGFLAIFIATPFIFGLGTGKYPPLSFFVILIAMILFLYFIMKKLVFDMVDEVVDRGDALLIRNGRQRDRVALSDIININYSPLISPPRVTLTLRKPSVFGSEVTFCAPLRFVPFAKSPIIDQLIVRVDAARRR